MTFVLGGARSGKSEVAERLAASLPQPVTYVATAVVDGSDPEWERRVAAHRSRRPTSWETVEAHAALPEALLSARGTVLLDGLGTWLAGCEAFEADAGALCDALRSRAGDTVVVSDEVGLGVHPSTELGLRFRDALGLLNQAVAAVSDEVLFVVAGRVLRLEDRRGS